MLGSAPQNKFHWIKPFLELRATRSSNSSSVARERLIQDSFTFLCLGRRGGTRRVRVVQTGLSLQPSSPACIKNKHLHAWWCRVYDVVLLSLPGIVMVLRSKGAWSRKSFTAFPQRSQSLHSPPNAGSCGSLSLAPGGGSGGALGTPSALGKWEGQGVIVRHPGAKRKLWLSTVSIEQVPPWGGGRADLGLVRPQALFQPQAGSMGRRRLCLPGPHRSPSSCSQWKSWPVIW